MGMAANKTMPYSVSDIILYLRTENNCCNFPLQVAKSAVARPMRWTMSNYGQSSDSSH